MGIWLLHTMPGSARCSVTFYTDSQTVICQLLHQFTGSGSYIVNSIHSHVDRPLKFAWILSHKDVHGNMEADTLAARAARGHSSPAEHLPPLLQRTLPDSTDAEKWGYRKELQGMWSERWQQSPRRERMERMDKTFLFMKFQLMINRFTRAQTSLLIQLRSGHIPLNAHLFCFKCVDSNKCKACLNCLGTTPSREMVSHFLFECPAYRNKRQHLDTVLGCQNRDFEYIMSKAEHTRELLQYIAHTGQLQDSFSNVTAHAGANPAHGQLD